MKISDDQLSVTFDNVDEALKHLQLMGVKVGARHSASDAKMLQDMHDYCVGLGAACEAKEEKSARVEVVKDEADKLNTSYAKSISSSFPIDKLAVKYVSKDTIKHPVFIWGSEKQTDLEKEFFTRETDFWDKVLGKSTRPLTWDHAQDPGFKADPLIGKTIEWEDDDIARWAVSTLEVGHKYRKAIDELIERKSLGSAAIATPVIGASSDSAPQYVKRVKVGKSTWLARWPWFATALTVSPCEPLMVAAGMGTEFLKSLGVELPDVDGSRQRYEYKKRQTELLKLINKE